MRGIFWSSSEITGLHYIRKKIYHTDSNSSIVVLKIKFGDYASEAFRKLDLLETTFERTGNWKKLTSELLFHENIHCGQKFKIESTPYGTV